MLVLHGTPLSNYYNKVKMALLEKRVPFEERFVPTYSSDAQVLACSPLARVPFVTTPDGALCESQVIVDWLEATQPEPPLLPRTPFRAAKVRELLTFIEWNLDMLARELYAAVFFGHAPRPAARLAEIEVELTRRARAFAQLAKFSPYVAGDSFTMADCSAYTTLPLVAIATRATWGRDMLAEVGMDLRAYSDLVGARPSAQAVTAARKAEAAKLVKR